MYHYSVLFITFLLKLYLTISHEDLFFILITMKYEGKWN